MLSKPGEARKSSTASSRRRKVVEENLEDVVRRLQRLPTNKSCADCSSKLTQCVNLTHGTFVCMACSGVHREFNHKIKGIGHSSFAPDEVARLRHPSSGNEAVNARYLARYGRSERMKPPANNNDLQHLRSWIQQKYIDKHWCESDTGSKTGGGGGRSGSGGSSAAKSSSSGRSMTKSSKSKGESSSRRKIMPKVKEDLSGRPATSSPTAPAPAADPFGFDSIAPASTANNDAGWDAFGGSSQNASAPAFQADFGAAAAAPPPPTAAPPAAAPAPAFQADFGGFSQQPQPTMVSLPPAGPPHQAPQPSFQANFGQNPPAQLQPQQQQQQSNQMQDFASFPSAQQPQQTQMQQQQNVNNQQGEFANFSSVQQPQQQMQMQQPNQPMHGGVHTGNNNNLQQTQGGGGGMVLDQPPQQPQGGMNFGQVLQQQPSQPHMMQQPQQQQGQPGFAKSSPVPPQQSALKQVVGQPPNNMQMQAQQQQQMSQHNTGQPPIQPTGMIQPAPQPAQTAPTMQGDARLMMNQRESVVSDITFDEAHPPPSAPAPAPAPAPPSSSQPQTDGEHSAASGERATVDTNPNAFRSVDDDRKSAFDDAFGGLSLEPAPATYSAPSATSSPPTEKKNKDLNFTKYHEGQKVVYSSMEGTCLATVAKVHYDDELHPYYTIHVNGRERQTNDAHLSLPNESSMMQDNLNSVAPTSANGAPSVLLQETASMLQRLNSQQLMQVHQFVASMVASGNNIQGAADPSPGQSLQMNSANLQQQNQMSFGSVNNSVPSSMGNGLPAAPMGEAPMPPSAQYSIQQNSNHRMTQAPTPTMGMSGAPTMSSPAQAPAPAQSFMRQNGIPHQPHPTMGMGTTNNTVQQTSSHGILPGAMPGMGAPPPAGAPTPPSAMPPPPPQGQALAGEEMGQFAMQQQQQPPSQHGGMGMGGAMNSMPAAAPPPPPAAAALPPVEKEGNPFDFY